MTKKKRESSAFGLIGVPQRRRTTRKASLQAKRPVISLEKGESHHGVNEEGRAWSTASHHNPRPTKGPIKKFHSWGHRSSEGRREGEGRTFGVLFGDGASDDVPRGNGEFAPDEVLSDALIVLCFPDDPDDFLSKDSEVEASRDLSLFSLT